MDIAKQAAELEAKWRSPRYKGIRRDYSATDVVRLRGTVKQEFSLARHGAERLWTQLTTKNGAVRTFGALTGAQAVQMVRAGLDAIYLSGWQGAAHGHLSAQQ